MFGKNTNLEINTPFGWQDFHGIQKLSGKKVVDVLLESGKKITVSVDHRFLEKDRDYCDVKTLHSGDCIKTKSGFEKIALISPREDIIDLYDAVEVGKKHCFYTNDIVSHNCDFIGSTDTLISGPILRSIPFQNPFKTLPDGVRYFELPQKNRIYLASADISRGVGQDYHAMCIVDITELPYKIVCTFKNNEMSPLVVPTALHSLCKQYNDAYLLVEINDIGQQVADILHNEYEYDGLLSVSVRGRKGQVMDGGFGRGENQLGVRTTEVTKKLGCSMLKTLVEDQKLIINDFNLLEELTTFVHKKGTYQADDGQHDDLVMSVVLTCWVISQPYFKDLLNMDFRRRLHQDKIDQLEEDLVPFGFIVDGSNSDNIIVDGDGTLWTIQQ